MTPQFSVVISLYNKFGTIKRAIRSVVAQTCRDWELIVVDDGSTDDSLSVVRKMSKEVPMIIVEKPNGGPSSARNAGANVAKGKYIALLDSDDFWYPRHLERMRKVIEIHPEIKLFGGGYERTVGEFLFFTIPWGGYKITDMYSAFRYGQPINASSVVIERNLWMKVGGFDSRYSFYEDYEFFFRLGMYTKCCTVRKISARYTQDACEQITKRCRELSRENYPHLAYIDSMICSGEAPEGMIKFAETRIRTSLALHCRKGDEIGYKNWESEFPFIYELLPKNSPLLRVRGLVSFLCAELYYRHYQLRNHLMIWRRVKR